MHLLHLLHLLHTDLGPYLKCPQGSPMKIIKRYSDFDDLRQKLVKTFPHSVGSMPPCMYMYPGSPPIMQCVLADLQSNMQCPRRALSVSHDSASAALATAASPHLPVRAIDIDPSAARFRSRFLEKRRVGLAHFLKYVHHAPFRTSPSHSLFLAAYFLTPNSPARLS